eukprot:3099309-Prymnesium_polylepis.1
MAGVRHAGSRGLCATGDAGGPTRATDRYKYGGVQNGGDAVGRSVRTGLCNGRTARTGAALGGVRARLHVCGERALRRLEEG